MTRKLPDYAKADVTPPDWLDLEVLIDGVLSEEVVEANTQEGWYVVHKRDARGRLLLRGDTLVTEKRRGTVEFRWRA